MLSSHPMSLAAFSLMAGILLSLSGVDILGAIPLAVAAGIIYFRLRRLSFTPAGVIRTLPLQWTWIALLFAAIGLISAGMQHPDEVDFSSQKTLPVLYGEIADCRTVAYGDRLTVDLRGMTDSVGSTHRPLFNTRVSLLAPPGFYMPHQRIVFKNHLNRLSEDSSRQRAPRHYSAIPMRWQMNLQSGSFTLLPPGRTLAATTELWRQSAAIAIDHSGLSAPTCAFLQTILLGMDTNISDNERKVFADAGISHILAVSGLHMGIVAAMIYILTAPLVLCRARRGRFVAVALFTWAYVIISGCHLSAIRAAVMVSILMAGKLLERKHFALNALCVAVVFILVWRPMALLDVGFQLSVLCTAAILLFSEVTAYPGRAGTPWERLYSSIRTSVLAVSASWPLTAYYFRIFPTMFIPVNILFLPVLPIYMLISVIHVSLSIFGIAPQWSSVAIDGGYMLLTRFCAWLTQGTVLEFSVSAVTPLLWIAAIGASAMFTHSAKKLKWGIGATTFAAAAIVSIWLVPGYTPRDGLIISRKGTSVEVAAYTGGRETMHNITLGRSAVINCDEKKLAVAGSNISGICQQVDVLLITRPAIGSWIPMLRSLHPSVIAIHPSVHPCHVEEIEATAHKAGIQVWDIRTQGPLRLLHGENQ